MLYNILLIQGSIMDKMYGQALQLDFIVMLLYHLGVMPDDGPS